MTREAKKKPWYRPRNVVLAVVMLLLVLTGREVYLAYTAERGSAIDYAARLHELNLVRQGVTEAEPNGWDDLSAAYAILDQALADLKEELGAYPPVDEARWWQGRDWPVDVRVLVEPDDVPATALANAARVATMVDERGGLDRLRRALAHAKVLPPPIDTRPLALHEVDKGARNYAYILAWRLERAAEDDQGADLVESTQLLFALARVYTTHGLTIDYLLGYPCADRAYDALHRAIVRGHVGGDEAAALLDVIGDQAPLGDLTGFAHASLIEWSDTLQWAFTPGGRRILYHPDQQAGFPMTQNGSHPLVNCASVFFPRKRTELDAAKRFYDEWRAISTMTAQELPAVADPSRIVADRRLFMYLVHPWMGKVRHAHDRVQMTHAATRIMLALEMHRARTGAYPPSLDALAPGDIAAAPLDPISGGPFGYRPFHSGEDPHGRPYLLYSFGMDAQDNAGAELRSRYTAIQAKPGEPPKDGFDFVINAPLDQRD